MHEQFQMGAALKNCFGCIDGPDENQREVYNGHKLQSVSLPNGMIANSMDQLISQICLSLLLNSMQRYIMFKICFW